MPRPLGSLDILRDEVRLERDAQLRHFDALDAKAGIVLGFAGALAALAPLDRSVIVDVGRIMAVLGALTALWAFWPRTFPILELQPLRAAYLGAEPEFTVLRLVDTQIQMAGRTRDLLIEKARRLKLAMTVLAIAALLVALGSLVS